MAGIADIHEMEQQLLQAMLKSDVNALDALLSDELLFTDHTGQLVSKSADLESHRSGKVKIQAITPSEQQIRLYQDCAIVSVLMAIKGTYLNQPFQGKNRYTRIWRQADGAWKIVAAHATGVHS